MTDNKNPAPAPAPAQTPSPSPAPEPSPMPGPAPAPSPSPAPSPAPAGEVYKPEGIADHMLGKNNQETIDKLNAAVLGFRKDLSKKGVPENADQYEFKEPEAMKGKILRPGEDGKDPMLEKAKGIFHKHNIPAAAFQDIITEVFGAAAELAGNKDGGEGDADFAYKNMGGPEKAKAAVDGASVWIDGLLQNRKISDGTAKELKLMSTYSEGLKAIMEFRTMTGEKPIPVVLTGVEGDRITKEMLDERVADQKYWLTKDPAFIAETTALFQNFYNKNKN